MCITLHVDVFAMQLHCSCSVASCSSIFFLLFIPTSSPPLSSSLISGNMSRFTVAFLSLSAQTLDFATDTLMIASSGVRDDDAFFGIKRLNFTTTRRKQTGAAFTSRRLQYPHPSQPYASSFFSSCWSVLPHSCIEEVRSTLHSTSSITFYYITSFVL